MLFFSVAHLLLLNDYGERSKKRKKINGMKLIKIKKIFVKHFIVLIQVVFIYDFFSARLIKELVANSLIWREIFFITHFAIFKKTKRL